MSQPLLALLVTHALLTLTPHVLADGICPMGCFCDETIVDCSSLMDFPTNLLSDTTVFKVSHLNVYEIPPYAFRSLRNITKIDFTNCNIANVAAFAFYKQESIAEIIFDKTVIRNLESYSFNELSNMTKIQFSNARIDRIKPFAFYKMDGLKEFRFYNTHIRNFYSHGFYECSRFDALNILSSNISDFVTGPFVKMTDVGAVTVEDNAFWNMHCGVLADIEALSDNLYFIRNTFYCNCSISWLIGDTQPNLGAYKGVSTCHGPDNMVNTTLTKVTMDDLGCKKRPSSIPQSCERQSLKPRPFAPTKGGSIDGDDGNGSDPGNTASETREASATLLLFIAFNILYKYT